MINQTLFLLDTLNRANKSHIFIEPSSHAQGCHLKQLVVYIDDFDSLSLFELPERSNTFIASWYGRLNPEDRINRQRKDRKK